MHVIRHDVVKLLDNVKEEDFTSFMKNELIPFFSRYKRATRASRAVLENQSLLVDDKEPTKWLWVTEWSGRPDSLQGQSFEQISLNDTHLQERKQLLKKLASFGRRSQARVFTVCDIEVLEAV